MSTPTTVTGLHRGEVRTAAFTVTADGTAAPVTEAPGTESPDAGSGDEGHCGH